MNRTLKFRLRATLLAVCAAAALAGGVAQAQTQDIPLITGEHWTKSTEPNKKAYLVGMTNMLQMEVAYQAGNAPPESQTVVPRFAKGLKGHTLDGAISKVDAWYAKNPGRMQQTVVETIWFELVAPGLKQNK